MLNSGVELKFKQILYKARGLDFNQRERMGIEEMVWHEPKDYKYNPFWQEAGYMTEAQLAFCQGHDDGYQDGYKCGNENKISVEKMEQKVEAMKELLAANARILRKQIEEEVKE